MSRLTFEESETVKLALDAAHEVAEMSIGQPITVFLHGLLRERLGVRFAGARCCAACGAGSRGAWADLFTPEGWDGLLMANQKLYGLPIIAQGDGDSGDLEGGAV